ncbi:MAG: hypothetical protein ACTSRI_04935 [Promethearchaeota archaeon]
MRFKLKDQFRSSCLAGVILIFASFFLDFYQFQAFDEEQKLLVSWRFNILTGWYTTFSDSVILNALVKPNGFQIPLLISTLTIAVSILVAFGILFKDVEKSGQKGSFLYSYANFFLITLIGYYLFVFPIFYLFPNDLYYPFLAVKETGLKAAFYYSIGLGYVLQAIAFVLVVPYSVFYYKTITQFGAEIRSPGKIVKKSVESYQEPLNLNKLIAEEEFKLKSKGIDQKFEKKMDLDSKIKIKIEEGGL